MTVITVTDHVFESVGRERELAGSTGAEFREADCATEAETLEATRGASVVFVNFAPITSRVLESLASGAVVIRYGVGWDNVDIAAADRLGVAVCNVPDYGTSTVADHAVSLAFNLLRRIGQFHSQVAAGNWPKPASQGLIPEFSDLTVGLLGTGKIGLAVASRLKAFGMTVLAYDPYADRQTLMEAQIESVTLEHLWARSNLVSLHAPANASTHKIVNGEAIALMPPGSYLVNTARGALVDLGAVVDALDSGHLAGVAFDVVDPEPLPSDHPIRQHAEAIITPHTAFFSARSMDNLQLFAVEEAQRALRGQPLRCQINQPKAR